MNYELQFVGADAIMLYFAKETSPRLCTRIGAAARALEEALGTALVDLVPSYTSLLVTFDPLHASHVSIARSIRQALSDVAEAESSEGNSICLPVYYSVESGQDLESVARDANLGVDEVIALHTGTSYRVYAIGFAPGFAYLGEVDERIARPRLDTPRTAVPRGSVAIANRQTAVYPQASPGGWNLIGLCPTPMFEPHAEPCMPVQVGDTVMFRAIDRGDYLDLGGELP